MSEAKDIGIKIEIAKDNKTGELKIFVHFNSKSSNVIIENNEYKWIPTIEEKELIDEAFQFLPSDKNVSTDSTPKAEPVVEPKIEEPSPEPTIEERPKPEDVELEKPIENEKPSVFNSSTDSSISEKPIQEPGLDFDVEKPAKPETGSMDAKVEVKQGDAQEDVETKNDESPEEERIIVEADADAIEAALKKHSKKDDKVDSFKEADEQTIVDRVLTQKKKGKWSKK
jgi:hypothetical protein